MLSNLIEKQIKISQTDFSLLIEENRNGKIPIVFLHGFTGSKVDWLFLIDKLNKDFTPIFIDLPGHGKTQTFSDNDFNQVQIAINLNSLFQELMINDFILVGYSMGGRIAYTYTEMFQHNLCALVIESANYGIQSELERELRRKSDKAIVEILQKNAIEEFVDYWMNLPFFASQKKLPNELLQSIRIKKLKNDHFGLAKSLQFTGTAEMLSVFEYLSKIELPVMLISGELDVKYNEISKRAKQQLPKAEHNIISDCGHNTHLEKPEEFIIFLNQFLENIKIRGNNG